MSGSQTHPYRITMQTSLFQQRPFIRLQQQLEKHSDVLSLILLFLWPWIILLVVPNWIYFNTANLDDSWIYTGHFLNFAEYLKLYPEQNFYYITRLSWILPGYLAYHVLPPLTANLVLRLYLFYMTVFAVYGTLRYVHERVALVIALLLGGYSYFLLAIGWDYVDGVGLAYFALLVFLLIRAFQHTPHWLYFGLAGAVAMLMLSVNIFTGSLLPAIAILFIRREYHKPGQMIVHGLTIMAGALATVIVLGWINLAMGGEFFFLRRSFLFASSFVTWTNNPTVAYVPDWPVRYGHTLWLQVGLFVSILSLLAPASYRRLIQIPYGRIFVFMYVLTALIFLYWQLRASTPVLRIVAYASFLIVPLFLALGVTLTPAILALSRRGYSAIVVLSMLVALVGPLTRSCETVTPTLMIIGLFIGIVWVVLLVLAPTKQWQLVLFIFALGFAGPAAYSDIGSLTTCQSRATPGYAQSAYRATFDTHDTIQSLAPGQRVYFWYNRNENELYQDIACVYMWVWNLVSEEFPNTQHIPDTASTVVVLSQHADAFQQATLSLKKQGRQARSLGQRSITEGAITFTVYVFELGTPHSSLLPIRSTAPGMEKE